jgi:hypothetical protein
MGISLDYYAFSNFRVSLDAKPHFNSFVSNKRKNGKVYGVQFDILGIYEKTITKKISLYSGIGIARNIGGYGITSGGACKKTYLLVNGNQLYDQEIGFHIIDNSWAGILQVGVKYQVNNTLCILSNCGYQQSFGRTSRMNFAGTNNDKSVLWNKKTYNDEDLFLKINGQTIKNNTIEKLPFSFGGVHLQLGLGIALR